MPAYHRRRRRIAEMNVVPYIDVMLVLLIIFMITSPLLTEGVNIELPRASRGAEPVQVSDDKGNMVLVSIDIDGFIYLQDDSQPLSHQELVTRVLALVRTNPKVPVLVKGDKDLAYGEVMHVMALLKAAQVPKVSLVTQRD